MITLTNAVQFGTETDADASLATAKIDLLNQRLEFVEVYGNFANSTFVPSPSLPGVFVTVYLQSGNIAVNGNLLMSGGKPVALTALQIQAVQTAMKGFQSAVENELINLGVFSGTVS